MGFDFAPVSKTGYHLRYNAAGFNWLINYLEEWGFSPEKLAVLINMQYGKVIDGPTCREIASFLEAHKGSLDEDHKRWVECDTSKWLSSPDGFIYEP